MLTYSLIDRNIASDYGKLGNLFELKNKTSNMKVLEDILNGEEVTGSITDEFSLEKRFDDDGFKSLLFYLVLITIDKLSNRDYINFDEKYVKLLFLTYCFCEG